MPLPSTLPGLFGAASPFSAALSSMSTVQEQQEQAPSPSQLRSAVYAAMNSSRGSRSAGVVPASPAEGGPIKMYSPEYYLTCALGGVVSCGATHTAVTPLVRLGLRVLGSALPRQNGCCWLGRLRGWGVPPGAWTARISVAGPRSAPIGRWG
jgi:hypothetical protein